MNEAACHEDNAYLTLTYDEQNIPHDYGLRLDHFQDFMKRYRQHLYRQAIKRPENQWMKLKMHYPQSIWHKKKKATTCGIRFFHCGEYGDETDRPHYHACIFGHMFGDLVHLKTVNGNDLYTSATLDKLWTHGHCTVGTLTFQSAAYVARYVTKKITGKGAEVEYASVDGYGELTEVDPPYATMSRRPGLGKEWWDKYKSDAYPSDFLVYNGKKMKPPKYYDDLLEKENKELWQEIKIERLKSAIQNKDDNTSDRLHIRQSIKTKQTTFLKRNTF